MPKAYIVVNMKVHTREPMLAYAERVRPFVASHGGRYIIDTNEFDRLEGNLDLTRLIVIEFPSMADALAVYDSDEYRQNIMPYRLAGSDCDISTPPRNPYAICSKICYRQPQQVLDYQSGSAVRADNPPHGAAPRSD